MKIGIIGCGFIGHKRAKAATGHEITWVADTDEKKAANLAGQFPGTKYTSDWRRVAGAGDVEAVIVATTHDSLAEVALESVLNGKHVLVEKPVGRTFAEVNPIAEAALKNGVVVKAGFNHRFHLAFQKAREIFDTGALGPMMFIRARYGHGGRVGYDKEWRADPVISGGGELVDQGVHLIDLSRWFMGDFDEVSGFVPTYFWEMAVEDNAFLALRTAKGQMAWLHAGWTEWKNIFCFEIFGRDGKLQIDGLGGSYGLEKLTYYKMLPAMGPPETTIWEYPFPDSSWELEFADFVSSIQNGREPCGSISDAVEAIKVVEKVYREQQR